MDFATFYLHTVLLTLAAFSFPAFEGVVEEGFHAAGLGGLCMFEVGRFVVGGVGSAAFEDAVKGEVEEGASGNGFDIGVLAVIPLVVEKAAATVQAKDAPSGRQAVNFKGDIPGFVPNEAGGSTKLPGQAGLHGIHAGLESGDPLVTLHFDFEKSFAEKGDFFEALGKVGGERFALCGELLVAGGEVVAFCEEGREARGEGFAFGLKFAYLCLKGVALVFCGKLQFGELGEFLESFLQIGRERFALCGELLVASGEVVAFREE